MSRLQKAPLSGPSPDTRSAFPAMDLMLWYDGAKRALPWRETRDPYAVWISEVMCQQTRVATVIDYYARWMEAFPNVKTLAAANEDDVFKLWQGLGYYSRARNVLRAAKEVVNVHGNAFPTSAKGLRTLPGIGRYTAAAIASIAFKEPTGVVDGNVLRVFARYFGIHEDIRQTKNQEQFWQIANRSVNSERPGDFNQAIMELGAILCSPRTPACGRCPIARTCVALRDGTIETLPYKSPKKPPRHEHRFAYRIERPDGSVLLARNPSGSLLGGMWQFPMLLATQSPSEAFTAATGTTLEASDAYSSIRHVFSHIRMDVTLVTGSLRNVASFVAYEELRWMTPNELSDTGTSTLMKKLMAHHAQADPLKPNSS